MSKRATGKTLFILDEPTTGLSFEDCNSLIKILHRLVDNKNSVILIEHHLDIIKNADWIVDLGPGAGAEGGKLIAQGTPENIAYKDDSFTGLYLKKDSGIVPKRGSAISTNLKRSASIKKPKKTAFSFPDRTSEKDYTIKRGLLVSEDLVLILKLFFGFQFCSHHIPCPFQFLQASICIHCQEQ